MSGRFACVLYEFATAIRQQWREVQLNWTDFDGCRPSALVGNTDTFISRLSQRL